MTPTGTPETVKLRDLLKKLPETEFKLKSWDCFLLCQWIRREYNKKPLPKKIKYNKSVLEQLNNHAIKTEKPCNLDLVCFLNENNESCIGSYILTENKEKYVLLMATRAVMMKLNELKIIGYFKYD